MNAWTTRATMYWWSLKSRVKAIAFVNPCPMLTNLPSRGVGFGLVPFGELNVAQACSPTGKVTLLREWFKKVSLDITLPHVLCMIG